MPTKKKAFALRINAELMKAIEKWAADEFRSTNGQIEWMLMESLKKANRKPTIIDPVSPINIFFSEEKLIDTFQSLKLDIKKPSSILF